MKLIEALKLLSEEQPSHGATFAVGLVCGFTPLHLQTFLTAQLRLMMPDKRINICTGLYGDFAGNLDRIAKAGIDAAVVAMEWSDLDQRLGLRSLGSWQPSVFDEILGNARSMLHYFAGFVGNSSQDIPFVISLPTLPLPPISFSCGWQAGTFDLELRACLSSVAAKIAQIPNVKVLNSDRLDLLSPLANRFDAKSDLVAGFPYKLTHASTLAELMSRMILPDTSKKGLITDLDGTLWSGILGEVGVDGVFWDLEHHSQMHGLYQRLLYALSEAGVLVAVASKNDTHLVEEILKRRDLVLSRDTLFPVEAHWGPKSESVSRILDTWNIGADSVVFLDDSPMELAEVKGAHPGMECVLFPKDDPQALVALLYQLRDLFGKSILSEEDKIRRESIRQNNENTRQYGNNGNLEGFLAQAEGELTLNFSKEPFDHRALELVNKTNQFNLNGRRYTQAAWKSYVSQGDAFLLVGGYRDKYGPLGEIAVLTGRTREKTILVNTWVMSCRAFSRRIEYLCLAELFKRYGADEIAFDFQATAKNGPIREFLAQLLDKMPEPQCTLSKERFLKLQGETFHRVLEVSNG